MKLFTLPGACSTADHIALHWTGTPFEVEVLSHDALSANDADAGGFAVTRPALAHEGRWLTRSAAILDYVDDLHPEAGLFGDGSAVQRAEAMRWWTLCDADLRALFGTLFAPTTCVTDPAQQLALQQSAHRLLRRTFERLDARLAEHEWLAGFRSVADAYLFVMLMWASSFEVDLEGLRHLSGFRRRMRADPGVRRALRSEGLAA